MCAGRSEIMRPKIAAKHWFILPPGDVAICRHPQAEVPEGARLASPRDLVVANLGYPFPWGTLPEPSTGARAWREHRMGMGGLIHEQWFVTSDGRRYGGAKNVIDQLPGSLRSYLFLDGGQGTRAENEGFAILVDTTDEERQLFRRLQLLAAQRIVADRGMLLVTPLGDDNKTCYVGFGGRCLHCPNPELITLQQVRQDLAQPLSPEMRTLIQEGFPELARGFPEYRVQLHPDWENWRT